jgi:hypothetical protein
MPQMFFCKFQKCPKENKGENLPYLVTLIPVEKMHFPQ